MLYLYMNIYAHGMQAAGHLPIPNSITELGNGIEGAISSKPGEV